MLEYKYKLYMNEAQKLRHLNLAMQDINNAMINNTQDKRNNFQHITLLIGTILGFSIGLGSVIGTKPSFFLVSSWVFDIFTLMVGSAYLIIETDSRMHFISVGAVKQTELAEVMDESNSKEKIKNLLLNTNEEMLNINNTKTIKEKILILFGKYQSNIEIIFYSLFVLSMVALMISFFM